MAGASWEKRDLLPLVWIAAAALALVAVLVGVVAIHSAQCSDIGERTGRRTAFSYLSGCYVEVNGRMTPLGAWRGEETH